MFLYKNRIQDLNSKKLSYSFPSLVIKVFYKKEVGAGTAVKDTPEIERVKKNQQNISSVSSLWH